MGLVQHEPPQQLPLPDLDLFSTHRFMFFSRIIIIDVQSEYFFVATSIVVVVDDLSFRMDDYRLAINY
jgi:hypothetical protein